MYYRINLYKEPLIEIDFSSSKFNILKLICEIEAR